LGYLPSVGHLSGVGHLHGVAQATGIATGVATGVSTGLRQSIRGESYFEYVPFEKGYIEQVPVERIEYVPVEKKYTDYYAIERQTEYVPNVTYETITDYVPQQRTDYVPQTRVDYVPEVRTQMVPVERVVQEMVPQQYTEYVPQTRVEQVPQVSTEMVPVNRVQEKVDYQPVEKTLVHYPQVDRQFLAEAERSGRIRGDLGQISSPAYVGGSQFIGGSRFAGVPRVASPVAHSGVLGPHLGQSIHGSTLGGLGGVLGPQNVHAPLSNSVHLRPLQEEKLLNRLETTSRSWRRKSKRIFE